jgi:hypothetical protein
MEMSPQSAEVARMLAQAMESDGAPDADVLAMFRRQRTLSSQDPLPAAEEETEQASLSLVRGDFPKARAYVAEVRALAKDGTTESEHLRLARLEAYARLESGDAKGAGRTVLDAFSQRAAHRSPAPRLVGMLLPVLISARELTRERASTFPLSPPGATVDELSLREAELERALWTADDAESARAAVAKVDAESQRLAGFGWSRALYLAGDPRAESALAEHARDCDVLENAGTTVWAAALLGDLLEKKHDTPGACAAYARVLSRWGHAKPRSVTGDAAKARSKALGCDKLAGADGGPP